MAKKKDTSKSIVAARLESKAQQQLCRFCGRKPEVVRQLTPSGKVQMFRKCCAEAGLVA